MGVSIYCKNKVDTINVADLVDTCDVEGTPRRCGGLGDVLSGVISAIISMHGNISEYNSQSLLELLKIAGAIVRGASKIAFETKKRGMSALDVIESIPRVFDSIMNE